MAAAVKVHHHHQQQKQQQQKAAGGKGEERRVTKRSPAPHVEGRVRLREREQPPRCGEVAGGTAAGCVAVCCCFPLAVVELVVLAAVRVPAALCVRAVRERRRKRRSAARRKEMAELIAGDASPASLAVAMAKHAAAELADDREEWAAAVNPSTTAECEKEVWASFYNTGFWRSPSQREDCC